MNLFLTILYTVLIFGLIIFVHELGHFITAKLCGVKVNQFALGMGPAILKWQGKETLYALRLLPIGGFVAMEGEQEDSEDERAFNKKSIPRRILICVAGATMNLLLGLVLTATTLFGVEMYSTNTVAKFKENATTQESGLQVGDKILKVNGTTAFTDRDIVFSLLRDDDGVVSMEVRRDGERVKLPAVTFRVTGEGDRKTVDFDFYVTGQEAGFFPLIGRATRETVSLARNAWISVLDLVTGKVSPMELSGPVGVGQVVSQTVGMGWASVAGLAAFLSVSIGVFNLLPFPALDGGRVLLYLIEAIRRKKLSEKTEMIINGIGMGLLLLLMLAVTLKDVWTLF